MRRQLVGALLALAAAAAMVALPAPASALPARASALPARASSAAVLTAFAVPQSMSAPETLSLAAARTASSWSRRTLRARGLRAYWWAVRQHGKGYCWGGTGPGCFDCSGLVMEAFRHAGIRLPRTAEEMLSSWHVVRVRHPRRGDIVFFTDSGGYAYHVAFWSSRRWTFDAADPAEGIGWHRQSYMPPAYRVR